MLNTVILLLTLTLISHGKDENNIVVPFTLLDKERLIRVEEKVNSLEKRMDSFEKRIDGLQSIVLGSFGILFSMMAVLIGFVLWERRITLAPVVSQIKELENLNDKDRKKLEYLIDALKEYSKNDKKLREILKLRNLL